MNSEAPKILDNEVLELLHDAIGDSIGGIINLYLSDVPQDLHKMQQALATSDFITLQRLAHSLKSSSANLGAMQTSALAADLEHSVGDGETDGAILDPKLTAVITSFDQTRSMFEKLSLK